MFPDDCFIQVTGIETGAHGAIRFVGICKGRDLFCRLCDWHDYSLVYHVLKGFFYLFCSFYWDFPADMLHWGYGGI